jgi:biotin carboxyl carrier protein
VTFDVAVNGRAWRVVVEGATRRGELAVTVGGRRRIIDASWIDAVTLSLIDGGVARDVRIHEGADGVLDIAVDGRLLAATVSSVGPGRTPARERQAAAAIAGVQTVSAPMPGRIVRVLVAAGDRVTARQPLVVVEAMKMENELRAGGTGVVKEINAREGQAIDAGAVLLVVEYAVSE